MAFNPFYSSSPSDSGLLNGGDAGFAAGATPGRSAAPSNVPERHEYEAPEPGSIDASAPEESLRDVPLPDGFLTRLRGLVSDL